MNTILSTKDYIVFFVYFIIVASYGLWIYYKKKSASEGAKDYFLAEGSLTWWAIGASLIASNISAEQFIGMSGSGFKMGLAIAAYEWMASITLIVVAIFFMPVYLKNKIFTMPQFLNQRYNGTVAMIMAVFWLMLYIVVNLMSILYLGAVAISGISGLDLTLCIMLLAVFAIIITLGGMKVIGYTDVIQVFFLVLGGLVATYLALNIISDGNGVLAGFTTLHNDAPEHFHMIFKTDNPNYMDLPGISVLIGGMWIANLSYWGCNQYITQRALGASLPTARNGLLFAAFLKLLMPVIVVIPGIAVYYIVNKNLGAIDSSSLLTSTGAQDPNKAYPALLTLLPAGLKGLSFAALTAAIVASLAGKANSIATIFTLDIYQKAINKDASEKNLVNVGKLAVIVSMVLGTGLALILGESLMGEGKQGFQYIQEYTGFVSPGIFAMFILGFFWKKTTSNAAMFATIGGFILSVLFKKLPDLMDLSFLSSTGFSVLNPATGIYEIPFIDRMSFVFIICVIFMVIISLIDNKRGIVPKGLEIDTKMFKAHNGFVIGSLLVVMIVVALYSIYW
ncbi:MULTISPECIES: sodium/sugar symporter [Sphingobacterium]|jgi:SSS family solute:Na+ symporter|uniref:sodium/sugar symporter n=1 Tax=Sphingobacterium TaxID=28453 RepID=UPI0004E5F5E8|nr:MULTISPECIES: sodium/sugar symporter [Sphingobacterium]CDS91756.1 Sodium/glucose cotransporter [Sphingobacterium sp. PM2-P1-29]SJN48500.1 putative sodium/hexose cotransport protein [Sphingobacterium faecium PCAi_F2.5]UPZ36440.1 sodium/sugar symporter [Sphingobacterium sp. PCS056]UXD68031.1 sodium/sugar symporter [Sphingobacterium faecium]WGQ15738.1 sodium/sugar symporter [Sphingobacterium faecium]